MVVRLRSLGECVIETPTTRLGPEAEILFATALYVVVERGRRIPREAIAQLLWPEVKPARAAHSLRQAFYKLRTFGVPLAAGRVDVTLPAAAVDADYAALFEAHDPQAAEQIAERVSGGFLAGYAPTFSPPFTEWLEQQRDAVNSAIRRVLVSAIVGRKRQADWRAVERLARRCIDFDPLNEEAALALAEAVAMHGNKVEALAILDRYLKEIGPLAREVRLPAVLLRRRVAETSPTMTSPSQSLFVGRSSELELLSQRLSQASAGHGSASLIWGEPGIGKTRLLAEFVRTVQLRRAQLVRLTCQSSDENRPLSIFVDAVPQLVSLPGALGCTPEAMHYLRRLEKHDASTHTLSADSHEAELLYANIRTSLFDLLDAITAEICVVIVLEDVHWADPLSRTLLLEVFSWLSTRRILWLMSSRDGAGHIAKHARHPLVSCHRLGPLDHDASEELVETLLVRSGRPSCDGFTKWCVATGGGNPFHLTELALHAVRETDGYRPPASLANLISNRLACLRPLSLRTLQSCAILGKHSTLERLESLLGYRRYDLLDSLDELEQCALLDSHEARIQSRHELLSQAALATMSAAARKVVHRHAAILLEAEAGRSHSAAVLWDAAEHWRDAGEKERGQRLLRACAHHSLELGRPAEAARILEGALTLSELAEDRASLLKELASALHIAGEWERLCDAVRAIDGLRESKSVDHKPHDDWELLSIEARLNCGHRQEGLLLELLRCTNEEGAPTAHRLRAGILALILADNLCDSQAALDTHLRLADVLSTVPRDDRSRLHFELLYHSCFGDHQLAVAASHELVAAEALRGNAATLARALRHSAEVLRRAGRPHEALESALEAYQVAEASRLSSATCAAANFLCGAHLSLGQRDAAAEWYTKALGHVEDLEKPGFMAGETLGSGAELALAEGRWEDGETLITRAEAARVNSPQPRSRARIASVRLQCRLGRGSYTPSDADYRELAHLFELTAGFCNRDQLTAALLAIMEVRGELEAARTRAQEYLSSRRERSSLSPELQAALARLGSL